MFFSRRVVFLVSLALLATMTAAAADPAKARKRLERDGKEFTVEAFLKEIMYGEPKNVELYLEAGMSADAADEEGNSALQRAAEDDNEKMLTILLKAKPNVDPRNERGETPLCRAAAGEKPKHVDLLVKAGADVNAVCYFQKTPLHEAVKQEDAASVALLLAAGATVDAREKYNETPLILAADENSLPIVAALIKAGADVNAKGNDGDTPLHQAVSSDNAQIAKALLDAGADPNAKNRAGRTPLLEAVSFDKKNVIPLLLAGGADPKLKSDGTTPLAAAREKGRSDLVAQMESAKPVAARTPAATAAPPAAGKPTAKEALAQLKKMGIETIDAETLFLRLEARDVRGVPLLIAAGVKPNVRNDVGRTPLWVAIENDDLPMINALIAAGADVNDPGKAARKEMEYGETLLMQAVDRDDASLIAPLIAAGADVNAVNAYGINALMSAAMQGKAEHVKLLIDGKANVNSVDTAGTPAIYSAVQGGNPEVLKLMLGAGAKIGQHKKIVLEAAADKSPEMKAILTAAIAKEPAGTKVVAKVPKTPPVPEMNFPKPVTLTFGKKPVTAKVVYDALLPIARKWQPDAELIDLGTLSTGLLDASGKSAHWDVKFYSRSAQKVNLMSVEEGTLIASPQPSNELRIVEVTESTILDTAKLNEIAESAGASAYTSRGMRPNVGLIHDVRGADKWYFNYDDPASGKNVLTIVIDANSGKVTFKDAK